MSLKGWIEIDRLVDGDRFVFSGVDEGLPFRCAENDPLDGNHFRKVVQLDEMGRKHLMAHQVDLLLVLLVAKTTPGLLQGLGWTCDQEGKVPLACLRRLDRFAKYVNGADDEAQDEALYKGLRVQFKGNADALLHFTRPPQKRAHLSVEASQIRIASEVLEAIRLRLQKEIQKAAQKRRVSEESRAAAMPRILLLLEAALEQLLATSQAGERTDFSHLLDQLARLLPRMLHVIRSPSGRVAALRLFSVALWGNRPPTREELAEVIEVLSAGGTAGPTSAARAQDAAPRAVPEEEVKKDPDPESSGDRRRPAPSPAGPG